MAAGRGARTARDYRERGDFGCERRIRFCHSSWRFTYDRADGVCGVLYRASVALVAVAAAFFFWYYIRLTLGGNALSYGTMTFLQNVPLPLAFGTLLFNYFGANDRERQRMKWAIFGMSFKLDDVRWKHAGVPHGSAVPVVAVPIRFRRDVTGFALCSGHLNATTLDPDEMALLATLADGADSAYGLAKAALSQAASWNSKRKSPALRARRPRGARENDSHGGVLKDAPCRAITPKSSSSGPGRPGLPPLFTPRAPTLRRSCSRGTCTADN
ncbi:MAG: hypothetical protein ABR591_05270 [Candidatus Velthaea sp.]